MNRGFFDESPFHEDNSPTKSDASSTRNGSFSSQPTLIPLDKCLGVIHEGHKLQVSTHSLVLHLSIKNAACLRQNAKCTLYHHQINSVTALSNVTSNSQESLLSKPEKHGHK